MLDKALLFVQGATGGALGLRAASTLRPVLRPLIARVGLPAAQRIALALAQKMFPLSFPGGAFMGGSSLGARAAGLMVNPYVGATAAGVAVGAAAGYGLYRAGQAVGLIDREQGFGDRLATGFGRFRDLVTSNPGHYDRMYGGDPSLSSAAGVPSGVLSALRPGGATPGTATGGDPAMPGARGAAPTYTPYVPGRSMGAAGASALSVFDDKFASPLTLGDRYDDKGRLSKAIADAGKGLINTGKWFQERGAEGDDAAKNFREMIRSLQNNENYGRQIAENTREAANASRQFVEAQGRAFKGLASEVLATTAREAAMGVVGV